MYKDKKVVVVMPVYNAEETLESMLQATIDCIRPIQGKMTLQIPPDLALDITKDIYGWMEDENPAQNIIQDALAELSNTISGRIMAELVSEDESFELGLPDTGINRYTPSNEAVIYYFYWIHYLPFLYLFRASDTRLESSLL